MKILFLTAFYNCNNAISNCLNNIYDELNEDADIDIAYLSLYPGKLYDSRFTVYCIDDLVRGDNKLTFKENLSLISSNNKCIAKFIKLFKYTFFKILSRIPRFLRTKYRVSEHDNYRNLRRLYLKENYDCVVSVSYPFSCHFLASKLKKEFPHVKWIAYYFDPFSSSIVENHSYKSRLLFEYKTLSCADKLILTKKIYEEFSTSVLQKYLNKSVVCEFPNVKAHLSTQPNSSIDFNSQKINCVFLGYIYSGIRSPKYFLDMIVSSKQDIIFYIIGTSDFDLTPYKELLGDRLQIVAPVSIDEAFAIMNDADILVNIGNSITNQLPSKIFDYISTGKPIVNVCKCRDCPTLDYIKKHPLSLNIFESDQVSDSDVKAFDEFCINSKGIKFEFDLIKSIYQTSTPEYVANQIMKLVR